MDNTSLSLARQALLLAQVNGLVSGFRIDDERQLISIELGGSVVEQDIAHTVSFCTGLLHGAKQAQNSVPSA